MFKTTAAALALALLAAAPAFAAELTPVDIVNRHMAFANAGNIDGIVGDYADDGVAITAGKATAGKAALRAMFAGMLAPKPAAAGAAAPPKAVMKNLKIWADGDVGFVAWEMNPGTPQAVKGTDSFLVRHGKILVQSVFIGGQQPAL